MNHRRFTISVYLIVLVMLVDQMSKWAITHFVVQPGEIRPINDVLNIVYVENRGVTFGMFNKLDPNWAPYFLLAVAAVILFLLGRWLWRTTSALIAVSLGFIMGGAIGNVIDRARTGAVTDFIDFYVRLGGREHHWPAFNVADSAIVMGVALLLLDGLVRKR